jgi:hydrogenase maturation protease
MTQERTINAGEACHEQTDRASILVLGVGNILLQDEGVGVRVIEAMQGMSLPEGVELFDGATAGADLIDVIADRRRVIVVDAVDADVAPGTVLRFTGEDFARRKGAMMSLHQVGFIDAVAMAAHLGAAPLEVVVIGIKPAQVGFGLDLSGRMHAVMPGVIRLVLAEVGKPLKK